MRCPRDAVTSHISPVLWHLLARSGLRLSSGVQALATRSIRAALGGSATGRRSALCVGTASRFSRVGRGIASSAARVAGAGVVRSASLTDVS